MSKGKSEKGGGGALEEMAPKRMHTPPVLLSVYPIIFYKSSDSLKADGKKERKKDEEKKTDFLESSDRK